MRMTEDRLAFSMAHVEESFEEVCREAKRARGSEARLIEALKECLPLLASEQERLAMMMQAPARTNPVNPLLSQAIGQTDDRSRAREIIRAALKGAE